MMLRDDPKSLNKLEHFMNNRIVYGSNESNLLGIDKRFIHRGRKKKKQSDNEVVNVWSKMFNLS
jgi:hypothetical protein